MLAVIGVSPHDTMQLRAVRISLDVVLYGDTHPVIHIKFESAETLLYCTYISEYRVMTLKVIIKRSLYLIAAAVAFVLAFVGWHDSKIASMEHSFPDNNFFNTAHADAPPVDPEVYPGDDDGDGT